VVVHTNATDSKGVTDIELWADGIQVAVTNSDKSVGQDRLQADQVWLAGSIGQHTLYVIVHDSVGKSTQSAYLTVNVVGVNTPTPIPTATPVPPTPVPTTQPTATPTRPAPPIVQIVSPPANFMIHDAVIHFDIRAEGEAPLTKIELWGRLAGQPVWQLLQTFDAGSVTQKTLTYNWTLPAGMTGPAGFYATVFDSAGNRARSTEVSGYIENAVTPAPSITPSPMPTSTVAVPSATAGSPSLTPMPTLTPTPTGTSTPTITPTTGP
jgi:hypothetical protein